MMLDEPNDSERNQNGRFRAGAPSPNPRGRPRKVNNVDAALSNALSEKVAVTEQGKRKRKSKLEITAAQLANKSAGGDLRAAKMVLDQARKTEERAAVQTAHAPIMTKTDHEIAALVVARIARILEEGGPDAQNS